jgi:hypothetical protein
MIIIGGNGLTVSDDAIPVGRQPGIRSSGAEAQQPRRSSIPAPSVL